jgi:LysM repeat protein
MTARQFFGAVAAIALSTSLDPSVSAAQSLRGSTASVGRMYQEARAERLSFYETPRSLRSALASGQLVRLVPDVNFFLHQVGYPFVRPATLTFVERLAAQYQSTCGAPLEVTSAARPATHQPPNSVARSVHPTGMAIDLHKPNDPSCRRWLRSTLLALEKSGTLEATEEFSPPHFHVAVFPARYQQYIASQATATTKTKRQLAATADDAGAADDVRGANGVTYRVRVGDTLWYIAQAHGTTVEAISTANGLDDPVIQPGQELVLPPQH